MLRKKGVLLLIFFSLLMIALTGCSNQLLKNGNNLETKLGSIQVTANISSNEKLNLMSVEESIYDLSISKLKFKLINDQDEIVDNKIVDADTMSVLFGNIPEGVYNVQVTALDQDDLNFYQGQAKTVVMADNTTTVTVYMEPLPGDLDIEVLLPGDKNYISGQVELINDFQQNLSQDLIIDTANNLGTASFTDIKPGIWPVKIELTADDGSTDTFEGQVSVLPDRKATASISLTTNGGLNIQLRWDTPPAPPYIVMAHYEEGTGVVLNWESSYDPEVEGYMVYRSMDLNGRKELLTETPLTENTFTDTSEVYVGTTYYYWVQAYKANGLISDFSDPCEITIGVGIYFEDPDLERAIREEIGKLSGQLTTDDLELISSLYLEDTYISSLAGIEYLVNLEDLSFYHVDGIKDFSPISKLRNLKYLRLYECNISDISFLAGLTNLEQLNLGNNYISDFSALASLTKLWYLNISNNNISDLPGLIDILDDLPRLYYLSLSDLGITDEDLIYFTSLSNVERLRLDDNYISNLNSIKENMSHLKGLFISNNNITDISCLVDFNELEEVGFGVNPIADYSILDQMTQLTGLELWEAHIDDYSFLANLTDLYYIYLGGSNISDNDLSYLSNLTKLKYLNLDDTNISNLSFLENLKQIGHLELNRCQISDVTQLEYLLNLTQLWELEIRDNPLNYFDLQFIAIIEQLERNGVRVEY